MTDSTFTSDALFGDDAGKLPGMHKAGDITLKRGTISTTDEFRDVSGLGMEVTQVEHREGEPAPEPDLEVTVWPISTTSGDFDF